jgi:predicted RNA-binding Zn-ribbon protein involved in translation (DUF1610 family)
MTCSKCGATLPENVNFCNECGMKVPEKHKTAQCTSCGKDMPEDARFCPFCGAAPVIESQPRNEKIMRCSKCNTEYYGEQEFCPKCGTALVEVEVVDPIPDGTWEICPKCGEKQIEGRTKCSKCTVTFYRPKFEKVAIEEKPPVAASAPINEADLVVVRKVIDKVRIHGIVGLIDGCIYAILVFVAFYIDTSNLLIFGSELLFEYLKQSWFIYLMLIIIPILSMRTAMRRLKIAGIADKTPMILIKPYKSLVGLIIEIIDVIFTLWICLDINAAFADGQWVFILVVIELIELAYQALLRSYVMQHETLLERISENGGQN